MTKKQLVEAAKLCALEVLVSSSWLSKKRYAYLKNIEASNVIKIQEAARFFLFQASKKLPKYTFEIDEDTGVVRVVSD